MALQNLCNKAFLIITHRIDQTLIFHQARTVALLNLLDRRRQPPFGVDVCTLEKAFGLAAFVVRHNQSADALTPRASGPATSMQQTFPVLGNLRMDDQLQIRQIKPARRNICCNTDLRPTIPQRLQSMAAFVLAQLTRKRDHREPAIGEAAQHAIDGSTGRTEHQSICRIVVAQHIDDGVLAIGRCHVHGVILNIEMLLAFGRCRDANRIILVAGRERGDRARHRCREHQCLTGVRRSSENELQVIPEAHIQHFIGLIEDSSLEVTHIQGAALDVIAQATRRSDNDMDATFQRTSLGPHIHAANTGRHRRTGLGI